jgi:surface protein
MFFHHPKFNQDIGSWDVSKVTDFNSMFFTRITGSFNNGGSNSISNWNTSNAITMSLMFGGQSSFDQEIGKWNVSKVGRLDGLLNNNFVGLTPPATGIFNNSGSTSINNWTTSLATTTRNMFAGQMLFNQNIGSWNVSNVTDMAYMFQSPNFNNGGSPTINNWNVSKVTNMSRMFQASGSKFDQPLNNWNVSLVTDFINFMDESSFPNSYSVANYTDLLIGWASRPVRPNISIRFSNNKYTSAASASRAILTSAPNNWTIADGGQI